MDVFVTSKNTGPSWNSDPLHVVYIGTSLDAAIEKVGDFVRYERDIEPVIQSSMYGLPTAIPQDTEPRLVKYYGADGWWYSIVKIRLG
jgi:hypothetical protein